MNLARQEANHMNILNDNKELQQRIIYLMTVLEDTTTRMEAMIQSDSENRVLMEKGAASIQLLNEQLEHA